MLFLHKGAARGINYAVYTGARPKGHEEDYELIHPGEAQVVSAVKTRVQDVFSKLDIEVAALHPVLAILDRWIRATPHDLAKKNIYQMMSPEGMEARRVAGIPANWRYYNNYVDLVLALYGEYLSASKLNNQETMLAAMVLESAPVLEAMRSVAAKISAYAEVVFKTTAERDKLLKGKYATLHEGVDTWAKWTQGFAGMKTAELLPCLYDIAMDFKKPLGWKELPMNEGKITKENMRMNVATPEEDFDWTARGRWEEVPMWAGPSYTAQLMLLVAENAKCDVVEIQAFAYAIFAYWNQVYPTTATPVHRMYGVMAAARDFKVPAEACDPKTMYKAAQSFLKTSSL